MSEEEEPDEYIKKTDAWIKKEQEDSKHWHEPEPEMIPEKPEMLQPNKSLFIERYFSYFSEKFKADLLSRIRTRQSLRKRGLGDF